MMWGFGLSMTSFLCLSGWCWWLGKRMGELMQLDKSIIEINGHIKDIKVALIGGYSTKGLITKHGEIDSRLKTIEKDVQEIKSNHT